MITAPSLRALELRDRLERFIETHVAPLEAEVWAFRDEPATRWQEHSGLEALKARARAEGLWNLFLPESEHGAGLSNLDYAPLAEVMGRIEFASEVFNCSAPDTGNMETLARYGTPAQKAEWLEPLLRSINAIAAGMRNTG